MKKQWKTNGWTIYLYVLCSVSGIYDEAVAALNLFRVICCDTSIRLWLSNFESITFHNNKSSLLLWFDQEKKVIYQYYHRPNCVPSARTPSRLFRCFNRRETHLFHFYTNRLTANAALVTIAACCENAADGFSLSLCLSVFFPAINSFDTFIEIVMVWSSKHYHFVRLRGSDVIWEPLANS